MSEENKNTEKAKEEKKEPVLTPQQIMDIIPNRYPMYFIDYVEELEPGKYVKARKNVTINEPYFQGHFPGEPVMPGVLQVETLAQAGSIPLLMSEQLVNHTGYLVGLDKVKFRQKVVPGDVLSAEVEITKLKKRMGTANGRLIRENDDKVVCSVVMTFAISENERESED